MSSRWRKFVFGPKSGEGASSYPGGREALAHDIQATFSGIAGKRVLAHLVDHCHLLTSNHVIHPDGMMAALEHAHAEGKRAVVLHLLDLMGWSPADMTNQSMATIEDEV